MRVDVAYGAYAVLLLDVIGINDLRSDVLVETKLRRSF